MQFVVSRRGREGGGVGRERDQEMELVGEEGRTGHLQLSDGESRLHSYISAVEVYPTLILSLSRALSPPPSLRPQFCSDRRSSPPFGTLNPDFF